MSAPEIPAGDSHAACGPLFVSNSSRRIRPHQRLDTIKDSVPHPASALVTFPWWPQAGVAVTCCRPNLSPPRSDRGREGWPPFLSTCSVHMPRCQALSKHFPNTRQSCSCTPRNEPLSHNQTFLLLSRECTDSCTTRSSGHKGIHSGTFDHAEPNAPSPEQLSVYYLMYSQPSSPRAGGAADGKLWLR